MSDQRDIAPCFSSQPSSPYLHLLGMSARLVKVQSSSSGIEELKRHVRMGLIQSIQRSRVENHGSMLPHPSLECLRPGWGLGYGGGCGARSICEKRYRWWWCCT